MVLRVLGSIKVIVDVDEPLLCEGMSRTRVSLELDEIEGVPVFRVLRG